LRPSPPAGSFRRFCPTSPHSPACKDLRSPFLQFIFAAYRASSISALDKKLVALSSRCVDVPRGSQALRIGVNPLFLLFSCVPLPYVCVWPATRVVFYFQFFPPLCRFSPEHTSPSRLASFSATSPGHTFFLPFPDAPLESILSPGGETTQGIPLPLTRAFLTSPLPPPQGARLLFPRVHVL